MKKRELQKLVAAYKLGKVLGEGGNGVVYAATDITSGERVALKLFQSAHLNRYARFKDEVKVMTTRLEGSDHTVQILKSHFPEVNEKSVAWYAMPLGVPSTKELKGLPWEEKVQHILDLARGLMAIHDVEVAHRDIKPDNLLFISGRGCFADFGLAKFPESSRVTKFDEPIGPADYLAPEMRFNSDTSDPFPADVYSFCKTIWALLTEMRIPFTGQYAKHDVTGLSKHDGSNGFVVEPLEELLLHGTDPLPALRPTISQVIQLLEGVVQVQQSFSGRNLAQWKAVAKDLLSANGVSRIEWLGLDDITGVLQELSRHEQLNHCILPSGGGDDIDEVFLTEHGQMIALRTGGNIHILKPTHLAVELFSDPEFNFAVLTCGAVDPIGSSQIDDIREYLIQFDDGAEYGDPEKNESGAGVECVRYYRGGQFLIMAKTGKLNKINYVLLEETSPTDLASAVRNKLSAGAAVVTMRVPRLRKADLRVVPKFALRYLDKKIFTELCEIDERLSNAGHTPSKRLGSSLSNRDVISNVLRGPNRNESKAKSLVDGLSQSQTHELMLLLLCGRNDFKIHRYNEYVDGEILKYNSDYVFEKLGNGYLRLAIAKFAGGDGSKSFDGLWGERVPRLRRVRTNSGPSRSGRRLVDLTTT